MWYNNDKWWEINNIQDQKKISWNQIGAIHDEPVSKEKKTDIGGRLYDEVGFVFDLNKKETVWKRN